MPNSHKNIEHKIKDSFNSMNHKAPDGLWDNISEGLEGSSVDNPIDSKIKNSFESKTHKAPEHIYKNIEKQLVIDSVWQSINKILNTDLFYLWLKRIGFAVVPLLLLLFTFKHFYQEKTEAVLNPIILAENPEQEDHIKPEQEKEQAALLEDDNQSQSVSENKGVKSLKPTTQAKIVAPKESQVKYQKSTKLITNNSNKRMVSEIDVNDNFEADKQLKRSTFNLNKSSITNSPRAIEKSSIALMTPRCLYSLPLNVAYQEIDFSKLNISNGLLTELESSNAKPKRKLNYSIGLQVSYNQSYINNSSYRQSQEATSLKAAENAYSPSVGLVGTIDFNKKNALFTEIYLLNNYKQSLYGYDNGRYYHDETYLDYGSIAFLYQRKLPIILFDKARLFNIKLGPYYAHLFKAKQFRNKVEHKLIKDAYHNNDYGLRLMLGHEINANKLGIDYGFNASYGLRNTFKGNDRMPSYLDKTHNYYIGLYLNIRYRLKP
jgi:hypothetical protein